MRIAFVTPYLPAPADTGGRIRMFRLAQSLARTDEVTLFACRDTREVLGISTQDALAPYRAVFSRTPDRACVRPSSMPRRARLASPRALCDDLAREHARRPFDAIVVSHSYAAGIARALVGHVPVVLDEHNVESRYHAALSAAGERAGTREVTRLRAWEEHLWRTVAAVSCVSDDDAACIRAVRRSAVHTIANGVAVDAIAYRAPSERASYDVLFVGLLSHAPNVRAADLLARDVMPRVWEREPRARLVLCGRSPDATVRALASDRVIVTGTVRSVAPYLDDAAVYANALTAGAGTSLKVPEALAAGIPLVSTAIGVRGHALVDGRDYVRADDAPRFAAAIGDALQGDRARSDERAARMREWTRGLAWERLGARFVEMVHAAVRGAS